MTGTKFVHDEILKFLANPTPEVLCIAGKWGVGKTYTWKRYLREAQAHDGIKLKRYAYVSLFGHNSLSDLKYTLFEETLDVGQIDKGPSLETWTAGFNSAKSIVRSGLSLIGGLPGVRDYFATAKQALFIAVRNQIVCIDDLERAGTDLKIKDVLGLISFLKEERGCKIVLLLNQEELADEGRVHFDTQLEKVADLKLEFEPTPVEAAELILDKEYGFHAMLVENVVKLGLTNLRVIKKIERLCQTLDEHLREFDPGVCKQAIHTATLAAWVHYQPKEAPPLNFLTETDQWGLTRTKDAEATEQEKAWRALLESYEFRFVDEFDAQIIRGIKVGYFHIADLKQAATALNRQIEFTKKDSSFSEAWRLYHHSFRSNANDILDKMDPAFRSAVQVITPMNLSGTIALFKELGRPAQAIELLNLYMEERGDEPREFYDLVQTPFGGEVRDPDVRKAFAEKLSGFLDQRDPATTLAKIAVNSGWNPEDIDLLAKLDADGFSRVFKQSEGPQLAKMVETALRFGTYADASEGMRLITKNATEGLRQIGNESDLNARRVSRYGIKLEMRPQQSD